MDSGSFQNSSSKFGGKFVTFFCNVPRILRNYIAGIIIRIWTSLWFWRPWQWLAYCDPPRIYRGIGIDWNLVTAASKQRHSWTFRLECFSQIVSHNVKVSVRSSHESNASLFGKDSLRECVLWCSLVKSLYQGVYWIFSIPLSLSERNSMKISHWALFHWVILSENDLCCPAK